MKWSNCRSPLWNRGHQEQQIEEVANSLHHCSKTLNPTESCMHSFLLQHRFKNLPEDHQDKWRILQNTKKRDLCDFALIERIEASHGIPSAFCNPNPSLVGDVAASEGGISGKDHNKAPLEHVLWWLAGLLCYQWFEKRSEALRQCCCLCWGGVWNEMAQVGGHQIVASSAEAACEQDEQDPQTESRWGG